MTGYFEPHNSSIDFCESNYVYTPYCAELWNSLSSLIIAGIAYYFMMHSIKVTNGPYMEEFLLSSEKRRGMLFSTKTATSSNYDPSMVFQTYIFQRYLCFWSILTAVGIGSFLFHGTLQRWAQACDEVPMVIANVAYLYSLVACRKFDTISINASNDSIPSTMKSFLEDNYFPQAMGLSVLVILKIALYVIYENYICFFTLFTLGVIASVYVSIQCLYKIPMTKASNKEIYTNLFSSGLTIFLTGTLIWIIENMFCNALELFHLHVIWHILAGFGSAVLVLSTLVNHLDSLEIVVDSVQYDYGFIPVVSFTF